MSKVIDVTVDEVMSSSYINYAMSVIVDRALPDVRDGLKPVHRRILFSMSELSNFYNKPYKKSARIVGDVIGKYHPHGDSAVYEAMVRMAQDFSMSQPLVDGQGNFGSIDGDSPAAMRYTESRMSRIAGEAFKDLHKETVNWRENYDGSEVEPEVLPIPFPNLIVNGVEGIAVGMAASIPPHNLSDVISATIQQILNPELTPVEFADLLKAPDFPTCGLVYNIDGFYEAVEKGTGRLKLRAKWHRESRNKQGAESIIVTEIPYQVNKAKLLESISTLVHDGQVEGITGLRDESNKEGIRIVIEVKKGFDLDTVFSILATKTQLETSISYNSMVIVDGLPRQIGLQDITKEWIRFRREVVKARYTFMKKKYEAKSFIYQGYLKAINNLDLTIRIIRESTSPSLAQEKLQENLGLSEVQAKAVLEMKLHKLTGLEITSIQEDYEELMSKINELSIKLNSNYLIDADIIEELEEIKSLYGHERKTEISMSVLDIDREDLIPREEVLVSVTKGGYLKRMPISILRSQNRGTKGKRGVGTHEDDSLNSIYQVNSHDMLLVFDADGQVYGVKAYKIPSGATTDKGRHVRNIIEGFEKEIKAIVVAPDNFEGSILTVSQNGVIKKTLVDEFVGSDRKGGKKGVNLQDGDALVNAHTVTDKDHLILIGSNGKAIRFPLSAVRNVGRSSTGVVGMKLEGAKIVGSYAFDPELDHEIDLIVVGEKGVGKKTSLNKYPIQSRSGKGSLTFKVSHKTGDLVSALGGKDNLDLVLFSSNNMSNKIKIEDVPRQGRATSGAYLMRLEDGVKITAVTAAIRDESKELQKIEESI